MNFLIEIFTDKVSCEHGYQFNKLSVKTMLVCHAKVGPSQNWSPLAKFGPRRTSFGSQSWSGRTNFSCQN